MLCRKALAKPYPRPKFAPLPRERVNRAGVYENLGLDNFDPVNLVHKEGFRMVKCWGVIYTCLVTRHVYLDLVMDLSVEAFLKAWVPHPVADAPEVKMEKFNQNLVLHSQNPGVQKFGHIGVLFEHRIHRPPEMGTKLFVRLWSLRNTCVWSPTLSPSKLHICHFSPSPAPQG